MLVKRVYNRQKVLPLFEKLSVHYKKKSLTPDPPTPQKLDDQIKTQQLFFHFGYHPYNVKSFEYQHKFKENILKPKYRHHLPNNKKNLVMNLNLKGWLMNTLTH